MLEHIHLFLAKFQRTRHVGNDGDGGHDDGHVRRLDILGELGLGRGTDGDRVEHGLRTELNLADLPVS